MTNWAVLVGIDTYEDNKYYTSLNVSVRDVRAICHTLLAGDFSRDRIYLLDDQESRLPLKKNILSVARSIAVATLPDDLLLFYFSGHGEEKDGKNYLIPRDGRFTDLPSTAISISEMINIMKQASATAKVLILDTCFVGTTINTKEDANSELINGYIDKAGIAILSSCAQGQQSYEWPEQHHSVFTYYLLEALRGLADRDHKGFVTLQDTSRYTMFKVRHWTQEQQLDQTPTLNCLVTEDIILTRYSKQDETQSAPKTSTLDTPVASKPKITDQTPDVEKPISILATNINDYVGDIQALREGRVHQELTDRLAATGAIKPGPTKQTEPEDILERYRSVQLHAVFLYTSEDAEVHTYITKHWKALASLSANKCDIYPIITQFNNSEDAYDFIEQLDMVRQSKARPAYSDLPGIFFWDNFGDSAYISFSLLATQATIRNSLRVIFEEIRREPTIAAVRRAGLMLKGEYRGGQLQSTVANARTIAYIGCHLNDREYLKELRTHLAFYENLGSIHTWDDAMIQPGMRRVDEINKSIQSAKVVILLLSPDFLISDFMRDQIPQILQAVERKEVIILSVIVRSCLFKQTPLSSFEPVNNPVVPLSTIKPEERESVWVEVTQQVKALLSVQH